MQLDFLKEAIKPITGPYTKLYACKTEVVELPVWEHNEMEYASVVKILEKYEQLFHRLQCEQDHMGIGGDLLTCVRFRFVFDKGGGGQQFFRGAKGGQCKR